jgi:hypothetical protein
MRWEFGKDLGKELGVLGSSPRDNPGVVKVRRTRGW